MGTGANEQGTGLVFMPCFKKHGMNTKPVPCSFDISNGLVVYIPQDMNDGLLVFETCLLAKEIYSFDPQSERA